MSNRLMNKIGNDMLRTGQQRQYSYGISLIEALVALAVMVGGVAAILGVHGHVVSRSADSRLQTAAMVMAQDKLEDFRTRDLEALLATSAADRTEERSVEVPGIARSYSVLLRTCWDFDNDGEDGLIDDNLVRATVRVIRGSENCNSADVLGELTTLVARQDPRIPPRTFLEQELADGEGILQDNYFDPDNPGSAVPAPGGFKFEWETTDTGETVLAAVVNPETGQAILPKGDGPLRIGFIHGNLILRGENGAPVPEKDIASLGVGALGVAFCRTHYPEAVENTAKEVFPRTEPGLLPSWPKISGIIDGSTVEFSGIRYSCVVADGWQRAIYPVTAEGNPLSGERRVCVGDPIMQDESDPQDVLQWFGREYVGYTGAEKDLAGNYVEDADGDIVRKPHGIRGAADGKSSVIGSLCSEGQVCWNDRHSRMWVPGGHHFFVDHSPANTKCASSMEVLSEIDEVTGSGGIRSLYAGILSRNPEKVFCTNEKEYTVALITRLLSGDDIRETDCLSYTRVSGFFDRVDLSPQVDLDGREISMRTGGIFGAGACAIVGRYWLGGGGYVCGFSETTPSVMLAPSHTEGEFAFEQVASGWIPEETDPLLEKVPQDVVLFNFNFSEIVLEPELTVTVYVREATATSRKLFVSGTVSGVLGDNLEVEIFVRDADNERLPVSDIGFIAQVDGENYGIEIDVSSLKVGSLIIEASIPADASDSSSRLLTMNTSVDTSGGEQEPPPESTICSQVVVQTVAVNRNQRIADSVSYAGDLFAACTEIPVQGNDSSWRCTVTTAVERPATVVLNYRNIQGNNNSAETRAVSVTEATGCTITEVPMP